jgi:hypothetical protein
MILQINLSLARHILEEANFPSDLMEFITGRTVSTKVLAEEVAITRRVEEDDCPLMIGPDGACWNEYRPNRIRISSAMTLNHGL